MNILLVFRQKTLIMDTEEEEFSFPFQDVQMIEDAPEKRISCKRCDRPERVCICSSFPSEPFPISTTVHILQHPREQDFRLLTTVPLLCECLPKDKCIIYRGKRFPESKFPEIHQICNLEDTVVLYPSPDAVSIEDYLKESKSSSVNMVVLDGTWREAKSIYHNNKFLHTLKKVKLCGEWKSEFVIRTQPNNASVSTLEAVAIAVGQLENKPEILAVVRKPLKALCDIQLQHGAQVHQSKEELASMGIKYRCFEKY